MVELKKEELIEKIEVFIKRIAEKVIFKKVDNEKRCFKSVIYVSPTGDSLILVSILIEFYVNGNVYFSFVPYVNEGFVVEEACLFLVGSLKTLYPEFFEGCFFKYMFHQNKMIEFENYNGTVIV